MTAGQAPPFPGDRVAGRTALVTGAGNGLGRAITLALTARGARVVAVGRTRERLDAVADEAAGHAGSVRVTTVDVTDPVAVQALADDLGDETIEILVNNAGVPGPVAPLVDIEPDEWDEVFAVNVRGTYLMCRAFLPAMVRRGFGEASATSSTWHR